jgi:hypothetical protein
VGGLSAGQSISGGNLNFGTTIKSFLLSATTGVTINLSAAANTSGTDTFSEAGLFPEGVAYTGGLYAAAGDLNGNNTGMQIVTSRASGVPNVQVFDLAKLQGGGDATADAIFNPYTSKFTSGAQVAVGDVDGDGAADIVTVPGSGQTVQVEVFNYAGVHNNFANNLAVIAARSFVGFESKFKNSASLAVGDFDGPNVNGDADQIALGAGTGGTSRIRVFDEFGTLMAPEFKAFTGSNSPLRLAAITDSADPNLRAILFASQVNVAKSHVIEGFKFTPDGSGLALDGGFVDTVVEGDAAMTDGVFLG